MFENLGERQSDHNLRGGVNDEYGSSLWISGQPLVDGLVRSMIGRLRFVIHIDVVPSKSGATHNVPHIVDRGSPGPQRATRVLNRR